MEKRDKAQKEQLIVQSATFNISDISNVIAKLVSAVEGTKYVPLTYSNKGWRVTKSFACVTEDYMADEFMMYAKYDHNSWETFASNMLRDNTFIDIYHSHEYEEEESIESKDVVFGGLLAKFGVECNPEKVNNNSFKRFEYVGDFIAYLFELQLGYGSRLTSEELEGFLERYLEREKPKKRLKSQ